MRHPRLPLLLLGSLLTTAIWASQPATPNTAHPAGPPAQPRWEWGIALAAAHLRDYPGSSHSGTYALPLPWFIWRSDRVEVGREGGRGILYRSPLKEIDFTLMANPPADIDDNPERIGMAELDPVIEPGLRIRWRFPLDDARRWRLGLQLPLRYAIAVGDRFRTEGLGAHIEPGASIDFSWHRHWNLGMSVAAGFAESGYANYYYGVTPAEATPLRPAYTSPDGYAGWLASARIGWRRENLSAGLFLRYEQIGDAVFNDSPLATSDEGITLGISLSWRLGQSRETLARPGN